MSRAELARLYLRERYPARRFVPLALLLGGMGILASPELARVTLEDAARAWARGTSLAYLLVLSFRVWDDLQDREVDAVRHPERITVRADRVSPLRWLSWILIDIAGLLVMLGPQRMERLLVLVALGVALMLWYLVRDAAGRTPIAAAVVVLTKYPVIAYLAAPAVLWEDGGLLRAAPFLLALYLFLCVHEVLDDPVLRRSFGKGALS